MRSCRGLGRRRNLQFPAWTQSSMSSGWPSRLWDWGLSTSRSVLLAPAMKERPPTKHCRLLRVDIVFINTWFTEFSIPWLHFVGHFAPHFPFVMRLNSVGTSGFLNPIGKTDYHLGTWISLRYQIIACIILSGVFTLHCLFMENTQSICGFPQWRKSPVSPR